MQTTRHNIELDGDFWQLISVGTVTEDGETVHAHLSSLARGEHQRNGFRPGQILASIPVPVATEALRKLRDDALTNGQPFAASRLENEIERITTTG